MTGDPILPAAVPGAAVSPGARICNLTNSPGLTAIKAPVLPVIDGLEISLAVIVALPLVLNVTFMILVPLVSAALAGSVALLSEEVIRIVSVPVLTTFQ